MRGWYIFSSLFLPVRLVESGRPDPSTSFWEASAAGRRGSVYQLYAATEASRCSAVAVKDDTSISGDQPVWVNADAEA